MRLSTIDLKTKITYVQQLWAENVIKIGKAYLNKKDYVYLTEKFIDEFYYFKQNKVLFKPTKASEKQFRTNKEEFISYFIGHNKTSNEDKGFALEPWKNIYFENFSHLFLNNILICMGNYFFTNYNNDEIKAEYSFGYILDQKEEMKIIFHHSSLPYNP